MCGIAPMEGTSKRNATITALARAGAVVALFVLAFVFTGVGPPTARATIPGTTSTPPGIILAQTGLPPDSLTDLDREEEDWEADEGDTLSSPPDSVSAPAPG